MAPLLLSLLPCTGGATGPEGGPSVPPSPEGARMPTPLFQGWGTGTVGSPPRSLLRRCHLLPLCTAGSTGAAGTVPGEVTPAKHFASSFDLGVFLPTLSQVLETYFGKCGLYSFLNIYLFGHVGS